MQVIKHDFDEIISSAFPKKPKQWQDGLMGCIIDRLANLECNPLAGVVAIDLEVLGECLALVPSECPKDKIASAQVAADQMLAQKAPTRPPHLTVLTESPMAMLIAYTMVNGLDYEVYYVKHIIGPAQ